MTSDGQAWMPAAVGESVAKTLSSTSVKSAMNVAIDNLKFPFVIKKFLQGRPVL